MFYCDNHLGPLDVIRLTVAYFSDRFALFILDGVECIVKHYIIQSFHLNLSFLILIHCELKSKQTSSCNFIKC